MQCVRLPENEVVVKLGNFRQSVDRNPASEDFLFWGAMERARGATAERGVQCQ
jgi:hypothetical protein